MSHEVHRCFWVEAVFNAEVCVGMAAGMGRYFYARVDLPLIEAVGLKCGIKGSVAEIRGVVAFARGGGEEELAVCFHHFLKERECDGRDYQYSILAGFCLTAGGEDHALTQVNVLLFEVEKFVDAEANITHGENGEDGILDLP